MSSKVHEAIADNTPIDPASDSELTTIWESYDILLIPSGGRGQVSRLHLPHPEDHEAPMCHQTGGVTTSWKDRPIDAYPEGWKPVCRKCLAFWRAVR